MNWGKSTFDWEKVYQLDQILGCRLDSLLDLLGVTLYKRGRMLVGPCPVHGGDRVDAFNLFPDGHTTRGNWKCWSRNCHLAFKGRKSGCGTLVGLTWGVLSHQQFNWAQEGDRRVPFGQVLDYLCEFVGQKLEDIQVDKVEMEKTAFSSCMSAFHLAVSPHKTWTRQQIRARMAFPATYYLNRGYSQQILDRYDVGYWTRGTTPSPMVGRLAVPVYDDRHDKVVGITARSIHPRCPQCKRHHEPGPCPERAEPKWLNNEGFRKELYLYNYWFARQAIRESGVVILVEGPGDVWRLEEAGIHNSVAMFGCELSDAQQILLEQSGALAIVHFPHQDEAGKASVVQLQKDMGKLFRLYFFDLPRKDVGEMSLAEVQTVIPPLLHKVIGK